MARAFSIFFILLLSLSAHYATAQEKLPDFGKVDMADMLLKECPFDKNAPAMNLLNYKSTKIYQTAGGILADIERRVRIKIFNQQGLSYSTVTIPFSTKNGDRIRAIAAITFNLDEQGTITTQALTKDDIFKELEGSNGGAVKFAFPNVKPGSIVELRYTEQSEFTMGFEPWLFDGYIPTRRSVCNIGYQMLMFPDIRLTATMPVEKYTDTSHENINVIYAINNVPGIKNEPFTGALKDNAQRLEFSILPLAVGRSNNDAESKWAAVNTFLLNSPYFGALLKQEIPLEKPVIASLKKMPLQEKIPAAINVIKRTVKWDGQYSFAATNIKAAWDAGRGTSAEMNFMLLSLLRTLGVECYPIITSINSYGKVDMQFASLGQFNCVDALILDAGNWYVVDVTQKMLPYTIPPFNVFGNYGLVVDKKHGMWFKIKDGRLLMSNSVNLSATIDSNGTMTGRIAKYFYGYAKENALAEAGGGRSLAGLEAGIFKTDSVKQEGAEDEQKPLLSTMAFKLELQQTGNYYFLNPLFLSGLKSNPFTDTARHSDIDFGSSQAYSIAMSITIPENFEIQELPANKEIRLPDTSISFRRLISVQNNTLFVRNDFQLLNPNYSAAQYQFVKQLFDKIYVLLNEESVFKKKL